MRHRFGTTVWQQTHDLLTVQTLLGHESPSQQIYRQNNVLEMYPKHRSQTIMKPTRQYSMRTAISSTPPELSAYSS
uniref:hypothetical protein n=1 Tax=Vaginimicrobium propionicum TaxID=1871034 RepID=UPI0038CD306E